MIVHDTTGDAKQVSINGAPPQAVRQRFVTHKIRNDKDMIELHDEIAEGRDVLLAMDAPMCTYVMVRELIPSKLALPASPGGLS